MPERIAALIREVARAELLPRFRALAAHEIIEKEPGDLVTVADRAAEDRLTPGLRALVPGCLVIGEEAAHAAPDLLHRVGEDGPVFVVDPLDGTANFAAGRPFFATMVARLDKGRPVAGWIYDPLGDRMLVAEAGAGAWLNGRRLQLAAGPGLGQARGSAQVRLLDAPYKSVLDHRRDRFVDKGSTLCAGHDYLRLVSGEMDFLLYWRTLPWDHAPGAVIVEEAGGTVGRPDGRGFRCDPMSRGVLSATDAELWRAARDTLLPHLGN
ncbi:inositol monophosphatase family protein [Zavarzinia compransoris]|uniref:Inositol monophosphatase n=1 Tax=Zavarzinia compransoris TaxID=1264899 RepID=A0A317E064_9PROT|nr:inositol monophosphatase [Zavarzinia compransoris]PWR20458.1 inositol monophosphatase [Zavarzinia compransoris]TDP43899.1 fructose-1,6-bisphosphatase/inositol monophosphatase family enzyme [Zavarzinia compransoris]